VNEIDSYRARKYISRNFSDVSRIERESFHGAHVRTSEFLLPHRITLSIVFFIHIPVARLPSRTKSARVGNFAREVS